jgi:putative redox protein
VRLRHRKIYAKDCEACTDSSAKINHIDRDIEVKGALDTDQRSRLLEIANMCPVHRTLTSKIDITTPLI